MAPQQPATAAAGSSSAAAVAPPATQLAPQISEASAPGNTRWKILVPAAIALVIIAAAGWLYYARHAQANRLTEKDTIVLGDFTNTTGDPVFDDTLKTALTVSLEAVAVS